MELRQFSQAPSRLALSHSLFPLLPCVVFAGKNRPLFSRKLEAQGHEISCKVPMESRVKRPQMGNWQGCPVAAVQDGASWMSFLESWEWPSEQHNGMGSNMRLPFLSDHHRSLLIRVSLNWSHVRKWLSFYLQSLCTSSGATERCMYTQKQAQCVLSTPEPRIS